MELPDFNLDDYDRLIVRLLEAGYALGPVEELRRAPSGRTVLLRHDVDLHIPGIEHIAEIESGRGVFSTFFIPLTLHFNPFYPENRDVLRGLVALGHRIGLHYDLQTYPRERQSAWRRLDEEVGALSELVGAGVESICMHNPWRGGEDVFRGADRYVHPHGPRHSGDLVYVSDACRAWRDEALLRCFGEEPPRLLLLNTHPELWLGRAGMERCDFARETMIANTVRQHRAYVTEHVIPGWEGHPAPAIHDEREGRRRMRTGSR